MARQTPNTSSITISIVLATVIAICALVFALWKLRHHDAYLTGWGTYITGLGTLALVIAALIAARTTIQELQEKRNLERGKWLSELYKSHFEESKFKEIRTKIDYENLDDIRALITKDLADRTAGVRQSSLTFNEQALLDKFTDYFNFYELIGYLCVLDEYSDDYIFAS